MGKLASGVSFSALGGTFTYVTFSSGGTELRCRSPYLSSSHPQHGRRGTATEIWLRPPNPRQYITNRKISQQTSQSSAIDIVSMFPIIATKKDMRLSIKPSAVLE
jgi:hypothetical protein